MREEIQPEGVAVPRRPYVPLVATDDLVFVSGQVPVDADGQLVSTSLDGQVRAVLANLETCLAAAGCGPTTVGSSSAVLMVDLPRRCEAPACSSRR